jgi:hypothetical protein
MLQHFGLKDIEAISFVFVLHSGSKLDPVRVVRSYGSNANYTSVCKVMFRTLKSPTKLFTNINSR